MIKDIKTQTEGDVEMRKLNSEASKCHEEKDLADGNNAYPTDPPPATNEKTETEW